VFQGHKAAAFVYQRRLHTITLLVYADTAARARAETTRRGFHVISWATGGFGMALVSDIGWDDLRQLDARLGSASGEKE
jgi:anti-sigma factor RsiW